MRKNSKAVERFNQFLIDIKCAKNDKEILMAGFWLLDNYHGFRYQWIATAVFDWIVHGYKGIKHYTQTEILKKRGEVRI